MIERRRKRGKEIPLSKLQDFVAEEQPRIQRMYTRGLEWLAKSAIRNHDGGYKSEYNPVRHDYEVWGGGKDCTLNTAGAVLALLNNSSYRDLAVASAEHLVKSINQTQGGLTGSISAGVGSKLVFPNYSAWAVIAICEAYRATHRKDFLEAASTLMNWLILNVQLPDGRVPDAIEINPSRFRRFFREIANRSYSTWQAVLVNAFLETRSLSNETENYRDVFVGRLVSWIQASQREDGSVPFQYWGIMSRLYQVLLRGKFRLIMTGWDPKLHPTAAVICLQTFLATGEKERGKKLMNWLKNKVGAKGLFFQYYWDSQHSQEEDVMPTAYFCRLLLESGDLDADNFAIAALKALLRAQITSPDRNADGAFRGVPGHPSLGESAFCWDTEFAVTFLKSVIDLV